VLKPASAAVMFFGAISGGITSAIAFFTESRLASPLAAAKAPTITVLVMGLPMTFLAIPAASTMVA